MGLALGLDGRELAWGLGRVFCLKSSEGLRLGRVGRNILDLR